MRSWPLAALRGRAIELSDDDELRAEFLAVRLVETGSGTVKLQNPSGRNDDIVVAVGMVDADLTERPALRLGSITMPGDSTALGTTSATLSVERQRAASHLPIGVMSQRVGRDTEGARRIAAAQSSEGRYPWR